MLLQDKAGLATGAGSGIGRATALALAESGASVMVSDVSEASGRETVELITAAGGEAEFFACDVGEEAQVAALVETTVERFGKLDFAFNNAGMNGTFAPVGETDSEVWDRVVRVNLTSVFYCLKHEVNQMTKTGGGAIVNTASAAGLIGISSNPPYAATKFGVIGLTRNAAMDYGPHGIRVNALAPGSTATPMMMNAFEQTSDEFKQGLLNSIPMRSLVEPYDQAAAVVWLVSDQARFVSGIALPVDGGWLAGKP